MALVITVRPIKGRVRVVSKTNWSRSRMGNQRNRPEMKLINIILKSDLNAMLSKGRGVPSRFSMMKERVRDSRMAVVVMAKAMPNIPA